MGSPRIHVMFRILSVIQSTEELIQLVPLPPDNTWSVGQQRGRSIIKEVNNGIEYCSETQGNATLNAELNRLLLRIAPAIPAIRALPSSCQRHVSCAVYSSRVPELFLDETAIRGLSDCNASLDIDLYEFDPDQKD